jgi:tripartite-type tricarboxylate transporter receptor subunit TctC
MRCRLLFYAVALALAAAVPAAAQMQNYPSKPVRLIVP